MNSNIISLSNAEFRNSVSIYFNNILDGFDKFINSNLTYTPLINLDKDNLFIIFFEKLFELNGDELILDFYINKLTVEELNNLKQLLCPEDILTLEYLLEKIESETIYYKLKTKSLLPFFTRLSTHEVFFCTMYFNNIGITIWGNYNYTFPCFFDNQVNYQKFKNIATEYNLKL